VRDTGDQAAWREFEGRYRELLLRFCCRRGLQPADAEDITQAVFINLSKSLPEFAYDAHRGRFRDYLYSATRNAIGRWAGRASRNFEQLGSSATHALPMETALINGDAAEAALWEEEWKQHHYRLAMATVRRTFDAQSIEIFDRSVGGAKVAELAEAFGMSQDAVRKARQRMRARMEELVAEQIREEDEA
jgi:RNA polymerase sigma-70 factor (ECF subfamily)